MKLKSYQPKTSATILTALMVSSSFAMADLASWQSEVTGSGATPAATWFSPASGSAPQQVDVGTLSGDRTFEFIVNAGPGGVSQALLGTRGAAGNQGLKLEQWENTGEIGITVFGVVDLYSGIKFQQNVDTHVTFVSGDSDTDLYLDGVFAYKFSGTTLALSGLQGLAGIYENSNGSYFDILDGTIKGFASYDTALASEEVLAHYISYAAVPEPATAALMVLGGMGLLIAFKRRS